MMTLDNAIWLAGILVELLVIGLLFYRRVWRILPFFCLLCAWDVTGTAGSYFILHSYRGLYTVAYLIETFVTSMLEVAVVIELTWSVLRPIRSSLSRLTLLYISLATLVLGAAIWPLVQGTVISSPNNLIRHIMHLQQTTAMMRVLLFLLLAGGSQLLSIGWRDRELQVATGLGFYSLVCLGAAMLQAHQTTAAEYARWNRIELLSYLCSLLYWTFCFAQKQAERREFTPQMRNLLLAMAGVARSNRIALSDTGKPRPGDGNRL